MKVGEKRRWYTIRLPEGGEFVDESLPEGQEAIEIIIGGLRKKKLDSHVYFFPWDGFWSGVVYFI